MNIDKFGQKPIYEQIILEFEKQIATGALKPGDKLPSVRALSMEISVNPNTIQKSYMELERLQITNSSQGQGRYVSENAVEIIRHKKKDVITEINKLIDELVDSGMSLTEIISKIESERGGKKNDFGKKS